MSHPVIEVVLEPLTDGVVVELDKQGIELALLDDGPHLEPLLREGAFGSRRDQILLAGVLPRQVAEPPNHGDVAGLILWGDVSDCNVRRQGGGQKGVPNLCSMSKSKPSNTKCSSPSSAPP